MRTSGSPEETMSIAESYGRNAKAGEVYCLSGELGAGKTVFAKGFAKGLGVTGAEIVSPTFVIVNEYAGRLPLFHMDLYRCGPEDMEDIGLDDCLYGGGVTLIEWPERIAGLLPEGSVWIKITRDAERENGRHIG